jgi:glycosyltransferase involved in cell wall biosynthesis
MKPSIAAIIIAKNEAEMIAGCLQTLLWCDEVIVINNNSSDETVAIAHKLGAKVYTLSGTFAELRNSGLEHAKADWVLYVDADERLTPELATEIQNVVTSNGYVAYAVSRKNILYGQHQSHGGWSDDWVVRLFKRQAVSRWAGEVHEHAVVKGDTSRLANQLIHLTHRNFIDGLKKSVEWTPIEARLLLEAKAPKVTFLTLVRKPLMEFWRRAVLSGGYKDGLPGLIEALVQSVNRLMVYIQLWELQQKPSLSDRYQDHEKIIAAEWKKTQLN